MEHLTYASFTEQPLKEDERELLQEIYARFEIFKEACAPVHATAEECRSIIRLRDPQQDKPNEKDPTLQLHTLKSTYNNCVAAQMANMPKALLFPETADLSETVEDLQDLVHHVVYEVNDYESVHRGRAEDLYGVGTVITQIAWDPVMSYGKGDVALLRWPVEAFLWDPQASDIQDARALMKVSWHPLSWYKAHYPEAGKYVAAAKGTEEDVGIPEAQKEEHAADEDRAMMLEYWYRTYDASEKKYKINVAYCAGGALLDHQKNVYAHGMYPFVVDIHSTVEGSMAGEGLVGELVPMMRYINRYAKYIDTNLRMSSKGRMVVRRGSGIDPDQMADWSRDIIEGDRVTQGEDWNWMQHVPFNGMISNQMMQFQMDMKQDSGMNQFSRGETTGGVVSGKAVLALQQSGDKITNMHTGTLVAGFKKIVKQILWLMAEFYDNERVTMVTGKDGKRREVSKTEKMFGIKTKGATVPPPYTVQVEVVSRDPARIESMNNMFLQMYTMAAQTPNPLPLSAVVSLMNIEGKDRILPVIQQNEQMMQQMQQMMQQNEQMQAQMQQMQKENDNLKMTTTKLSNSLSQVGGFSTDKAAEAGGGPDSNAAIANQARLTLEQLPEMAG